MRFSLIIGRLAPVGAFECLPFIARTPRHHLSVAMALTVSTDAIIEKLSGTAGADSQVHSITSGQIIVCVGGKVVDGGTKQFTVKVMHPGATAAQAAELARPIIKGLLGQAVTAGETAAAQEAGVAELVEAGGLVPAAPLPLPLVEEELVPPGLALAPHHALHSSHRFRRSKKMC